MKRSWLSWLAAMMGIAALIAGAGPSIAGSGEVDLVRWMPPDIATVADDQPGSFSEARLSQGLHIPLLVGLPREDSVTIGIFE